MAWSLDVADQRRLVSALMQVDGVRNRSTRDLYLSLLERELGHRLPFIRHEQDLHDVWQLISACLAYPGAIHTLVAVGENFHGGSRPMLAVRNVVDELLPEPLLSPSERRELRQLVLALENGGMNAVHFNALPALYRQAVGPIGPVPDSDIRSIQDVIAQLEEVAIGVDGVPPLLVFVSDLAKYANGATATALWDWVSRFAERLGLDQTHLHQLRWQASWTAGSKNCDTYLVIECRPDGADPDRFLITAWLQFNDEPGITLQCDDEPQPLSRLPVLLKALLIDDNRVVNRHSPELTIEFVLPRDLLNYPFDQIRITVDRLERRLGIEYPVVMRSLDRLRRQALHHNWRRKWNWLQDNPTHATVCWVAEPREFDHERLYALLSEHPSVCMAMAFPPWGSDPGPVDELWVSLQAGTPIVAWCRAGRDPVRFAEEAQRLLGSNLMSLPQRVFDLRRQAVLAQGNGSVDDHLGLHLALVFDDANRIPEPYIRLKPPA